MTRYFVESECEHGMMDCDYSVPCGVVHAYVKTCGLDCHRCPGGFRRELTDVETVDSVGVTFDDMPEGFDGLILAVPSRGWNGPGRYALRPLPEEEK